MKGILTVGVAGLSLLALLAFVTSCTRDTAQSDNAARNTEAKTDNRDMDNKTGTDLGSAEVDNRPLSLTAHLVEEDMHAKERAATVQVEVTGIRLLDPESGMEGGGAYGTATSGTSTGHLHYRLDGGPVIATPVTRLSFHELSPGQHTITVMLASPSHAPLGPQQTLTFTIPA